MKGGRKVFFFRDFRRFSGGHLKVWHYFNHVSSSTSYRPSIVFSDESVWDESNPWFAGQDSVPPREYLGSPDVIFLAGLDWQFMHSLCGQNPQVPIINLVQSAMHANRDNPRFEFLNRRAIRICVSEDVKAAIVETSQVNGPVLVIPNGMDGRELPSPLPDRMRNIGVLIAAGKSPAMGIRLRHELQVSGVQAMCLTTRVPRAEFLDLLRRTKIAVFLPRNQEGFFLPALESMGLRTLVVCPDCVGNRSWCLDGVNCFRPDYEFDSILQAVRLAITIDATRRERLLEAALVTVASHKIETERYRFLELLSNSHELWKAGA